MPRSSFLNAAGAVFSREARQELRRRTTVASVLFFALAALTLIAFSITTLAIAPADRGRLDAGMLWILLFFSAASGLPRSFVREEETGTALALRKVASGETVLLGKLLFNYLLFLAICLAAAPALCLLQDWTIARPGAFALALALAGYGVTVVSTFLSAIVSRAGQKDLLFVLTALPLLMPLLLPAVEATARAAAASGDLGPYWKVLTAYDGLVTCGAFVLMGFVWEG
jgi:heme exporter protein B